MQFFHSQGLLTSMNALIDAIYGGLSPKKKRIAYFVRRLNVPCMKPCTSTVAMPPTIPKMLRRAVNYYHEYRHAITAQNATNRHKLAQISSIGDAVNNSAKGAQVFCNQGVIMVGRAGIEPATL